MSHENLSEYSGVAGKVLKGSISVSSFLTGLVLGFIMLVLVFLFTVLRSPTAMFLVPQFFIAMVLSRFALNGLFGEWSGSVFSSAGGTWGQVTIVALRFLLLNAIWMLPMILIGYKAMSSAQSMVGVMGMGMGADMPMEPTSMIPMINPGLVMVMIIWMLGSIIAPPLFLIVSVGADSLGEIFSPDHWRRLLGSRIGDLFLVYVVYIGALAMVLFLCYPVFMGAAAISIKLAIPVAIPAGVFVLGLAVNLLGRLCGFFAFGDTSFAPAAPQTATAGGPASLEPTAGILPSGPDPLTQGSPPLMDAPTRVEEAMSMFKIDPAKAISSLEEVRDSFAPHPQILHALCMMAHETGDKEASLEAGKQALPLCLDRGHTTLAAEIFKTLWPQRTRLDLPPNKMAEIAAVLARSGYATYAANTYALILQEDADDVRAIKGILGIADSLHQKHGKPPDAIKLYEYLIKRCPQSPLAEYMRQGLAEAESKLAT